jgi:hypothetical protein
LNFVDVVGFFDPANADTLCSTSTATAPRSAKATAKQKAAQGQLLRRSFKSCRCY